MKNKKENKELEKLKELTFIHALKTGEELQAQLQKQNTKEDLDKMNDALNQGIINNMVTYNIRQIINKINNDDVKDCAIPDDSEYRFLYWNCLLSNLTNNEAYKKFNERIKKEFLKKEHE